MHQRRAGERADDRRHQHDGGDHRHQPDRPFFLKGFLHGDVADGGDKADAGALHEAGNQELGHGGGEQRRQAGEGENERAGEQYRTPSDSVRERPQQPLQRHAAGHIQAYRGWGQRHIGVKIPHHVEDPRLDQVGGEIGGKIIQNERRREEQRGGVPG